MGMRTNSDNTANGGDHACNGGVEDTNVLIEELWNEIFDGDDVEVDVRQAKKPIRAQTIAQRRASWLQQALSTRAAWSHERGQRQT